MKKFITLLLATILSFSANAGTKDELDCFAKAIYHEARGEPLTGQIAVGWVILNRVLSPAYPHSICDVVYQTNQFSWTSMKHSLTNMGDFISAKSLASDIIEGIHPDPTNGALYFNNLGVRPYRHSTLTLRVQHHYFYK